MGRTSNNPKPILGAICSIRIDNDVGQFKQITWGLLQGCVFSPDLFNLYKENILRESGSKAGINVGGYNMNNFKYADDTTLVSDSEEKPQHLLNTIANESKETGFCINMKRTECMIISKKKNNPTCKLYIHGKSQAGGKLHLSRKHSNI